jgi:alkylation response protein AidB-like acyl-CoA dehydrogenase
VSASDFDVPLPGRGDTATRFRLLAGLTRSDIAVGRMVEAHLDADAILHEILGAGTGSGELWGVWAAEPPAPVLRAAQEAQQWSLSGTKVWCSGASGCTHALVTALDGDQPRLFAVDLRQAAVTPRSGGWMNAGMARTDTEAVEFEKAVASPVGEAGAYLQRAGFWHGGVGVAACWFGGAVKVADCLYEKVDADCDDLGLMHLGAVDAMLADGWAQLMSAAAEIDKNASALDSAGRRAFRVRWSIEQLASGVLDRVARALGPGPLVRSPEHAQAVADLSIYIRQSHADRDLVELGKRVIVDGPFDPFGDLR